MAGKLGLGLLETLLEAADRDLDLENSTLTNPTITTSAAATLSGGLLVSDGRIVEAMTATDVDARHNTLSAAQIAGGVVVHTSATGGGTVTLDTAANIITTCGLTTDGETIKCYYINDGDQTLTLAQDSGATCTIADTGQTIAQNESAILLVRRTSSTAVKVFAIGA